MRLSFKETQLYILIEQLTLEGTAVAVKRACRRAVLWTLTYILTLTIRALADLHAPTNSVSVRSERSARWYDEAC